MDQGLAAFLGASLGAFATGIGAYISGVYAGRIEKKRARRQAYTAFLAELSVFVEQITELRDLMFYAPLNSRDPDAIRTGLAKLATAPSRVKLLALGVGLEGPRHVSSLAKRATDDVSSLVERIQFAFEQNEFTNMRETVESDFQALDHLITEITEESQGHL
ncbi:hypothetical protein [Streptomyces sp. NPDC127098]|uniref:hypothetical protein n=1 Tax=Streptomyces sp. NPDC127098 TaxID=3347137 RepID=UPI003667828F